MLRKGGMIRREGLRHILLIQLGDIGDVVYSFPCARALKENFPDAKVVLAVHEKAGGLAECCPWIDQVITVDKRRRSLWGELRYQGDFWRRVRGFHFDLAVDLRTSSRGSILAFMSGAAQRVGRYHPPCNWWRAPLFTHLLLPVGGLNQYIAEYYLDTVSGYGINTEHKDPVMEPLPQHREAAERLLVEEGVPVARPMLAVQPFSRWAYKEWGREKWVELLRGLLEEFDLSVVLTGAPAERARAQAITDGLDGRVYNLAGKTSIALLPALLRRARVFLGLDSAGLHIAAAVGTPTVGLYGPSPAAIWAPRGADHTVITKNLPCVPCKDTGCQGGMVSRCLDELGVDEVLPTMRQALSGVGVRFTKGIASDG